MEADSWWKELWTPKTFNKFSFVANVVWITIATVFAAIFLDIEINEPSRFDWSCALNNADADGSIQGNCFVEYEGLYNKLSVPPYGFVIVNFSLPFIVCVIYSVFAKPIVTRVSSLVNRADVERGQNETVNPRSAAARRQRKLLPAYFCQLITRLCLGIVFIVFLQTEVFYPRNFPSNFNCIVMRGAVNQTANATGNAQTQTFECNTQRAHKKTSWMYALGEVDRIFAVILLIEIFIIFLRGRKVGKQFMNDLQFYTNYLKSNYDNQEKPPSEPNLQQELIRQQHSSRLSNHSASESSKVPGCSPRVPATVQVDDFVYITSDASKTSARDRYLVVSIDGSWCNVRKFTGSQLRSTSYRIKLSECYRVPGQIEPTPKLSRRYSSDSDENIDEETAFSSVPQSPRYVVPTQTPEALAAPPSPPTDASQTPNSPFVPNGNVPVSSMVSSICEHQDSVTLPDSPCADEVDVPATDPPISPTIPGPRRSGRLTRPPAYLKDYVS